MAHKLLRCRAAYTQKPCRPYTTLILLRKPIKIEIEAFWAPSIILPPPPEALIAGENAKEREASGSKAMGRSLEPTPRARTDLSGSSLDLPGRSDLDLIHLRLAILQITTTSCVSQQLAPSFPFCSWTRQVDPEVRDRMRKKVRSIARPGSPRSPRRASIGSKLGFP